MQQKWGLLVFAVLAGVGIFSLVVGFSVWIVVLCCLLALVEAVDMLSTMSNDWDSASVVDAPRARRASGGV